MYKDHKIGVIVPAYNEELLIGEMLKTIPVYVDKIFVVNDASKDKTRDIIVSFMERDHRIQLIDHISNKGLGQTLIDGYVDCMNTDIDIVVVMAGDNQMHPDDLPLFLNKIIDEQYDYVKGNRLLHKNIALMPKYRFFGNSILTILTKFATGYYSLMDPQSGYTALRNDVLRTIPIKKMTKGYGYNADILCMLNIQKCKVCDVQIKPVYDKEISGIRLWKYIPKTSWILIKLFFYRMWRRYIVLDFHPLVLFFFFGFFNFLFLIIPLTIRFFLMYFKTGIVPRTTLIILSFCIMMAFQAILFAIWMDMDYNKNE